MTAPPSRGKTSVSPLTYGVPLEPEEPPRAADSDRRFARVIVDVRPAHLDRPFDYRIPDGVSVDVGSAVRVAFAGRRRTGWVVDVADQPSTDPSRVQPLQAVLGEHAWFDVSDLRLYRWVADRYAGTTADVLRHALPPRVVAVERDAVHWPPPPAWTPPDTPPCASTAWRPYDASGLLRATAQADAGAPACWLRVLPGDDRAALVADLVSRTLSSGRSALVVAPDPASELPDAALAVAGDAGDDLRSDSERDRYRAFLRGRSGRARLAVGERSAVFAPLRDLGLVVVDDEANPAYKERRSPRHHARDVALARARMAGAVCVVLGDLPSAALWRLLRDGHVTAVAGDRATERARMPRVDVVDLGDPRPQTRRARFSDAAARALRRAVDGDGAAVVLASRGGQGAALACRNCRRRLACPLCLGSLAAWQDAQWACATCGWRGEQFACPDCGDERWSPLAAGAARLAAELARTHPRAEVARMEGFDAPGPRRRPALGVLTRGSVVTQPAWLEGRRADVVIVPDADAMLRRPAFDAAEDALRLWMAVARWTDRLVLQTREPRHPAVQALVRWDPVGYWEREADTRAELGYPPLTSLLRITAPAEAAAEVADTVREVLPAGAELLGPDLAGEILVKTAGLRVVLAALRPLREDWAKRDRKVRIDVDPLL